MSRPVGTIDGEKSREQELEAQLAHVEEQLALETRRSAEQAAAIRDLSQTVKMQSDIIEMIRAAPAPMEVDEVLHAVPSLADLKYMKVCAGLYSCERLLQKAGVGLEWAKPLEQDRRRRFDAAWQSHPELSSLQRMVLLQFGDYRALDVDRNPIVRARLMQPPMTSKSRDS